MWKEALQGNVAVVYVALDLIVKRDIRPEVCSALYVRGIVAVRVYRTVLLQLFILNSELTY